MRKKFKIKKPFYKKNWFWFSLFFLFLFSFSCYFLFFSEFFLIKKIEIRGSELQTQEQIKNVILEIAKENFLKKENIFLFNSEKAKTEILKKFLIIEEVKISKKFPQKIEVLIKEREPAFLICSQSCYLVDKSGILFKEVEDENFLKIEKGEKVDFVLGRKILSKDFAQKILKIKEEAEKLEIFLEKVKIEKERAEFETKEGWKIYFDLEKDVDFQVKKLKALFEKEISKEKRKNLEYIDLRFGDLASVKYR